MTNGPYRVLSHLGRVWLFVIPWTVAHQTPLSMGFSRQEYWSGLPFPSPNPKERQCPKWSNQDTAVLISHVSKVMLNILQAKLQQYVNQELLDVPARCFKKRQRNQRSKCQHLLDHGESQGVPKENERKRKWSRSVVSDSLRSHGLWPTRLIHLWNFPGKSTRVVCHFFLQGWGKVKEKIKLWEYRERRNYCQLLGSVKAGGSGGTWAWLQTLS